jgi:processive 1,2-diacylglycerol beta-glucosyltransferase
MSSKLNRVLVLSASAGAGHVRAAQAIERALIATGRVCEASHVDILQYTTKLFRRVYAQAYLDLVNRAPDILGWLYDYFDEPWKHARLRLALEKLNATRFIRLLEDFAPDWTISTHFLPAELIAWLRSKQRLTTRQAIVVTDFDVQGMWLTRYVDRYFVALEETRVHLEPRWTPENRPVVDGSKPASGASTPSTRVLPHRSLRAQERRRWRCHGEGGRGRRGSGGWRKRAGFRGCRDMGRPAIVDPGASGTLAESGGAAHSSLRAP